MTNTISVPRDLLIDVRDSTNEAGNLSYRQHHIDHHRRLTRKLDELLEAPAVEVEGLEVVGYADADDIKHQCHGTLSPYQWQHNNVRLTEYNKAQAVIDKQAARIAELQLDADRYRWLEANSTYGIDYRQRPELTLPIYAPDHREGLDAAIDAAMGSEE